MWIQLYLTSKIRLQFPVVVCKDLKAGILVSLQQQQKWGLVLDLPKMQATFKNIRGYLDLPKISEQETNSP